MESTTALGCIMTSYSGKLYQKDKILPSPKDALFIYLQFVYFSSTSIRSHCEKDIHEVGAMDKQ